MTNYHSVPPAPSVSSPPQPPVHSEPPALNIRQRGWQRWLPGLALLCRYERGWLRHDLVAGLVLTAVTVPVGIAYAVASGLPGIAGLYATLAALLAYALFGPSRILVLGPDSSLAALVLAVVLPLSGGDPQRAMALAAMMALVSGALCVLAGAARLGFVTELLSKPIRHGFMNGIALSVLASQCPALFGFSVDGDGVFMQFWAFAQGLRAGMTNWPALGLGAGTLALILALRSRRQLPVVLIAVAGATLIAGTLDLAARAGVPVLGPLPQGLPLPALPWLRTGDWVPVLLGGAAVAVVSFADTSVLSRTYAARAGQRVDANQEMVGLGAANLAAGMFQGFPVSASASRTPVAEAAGARTQAAGIVGALAVAGLLMLAPNLLQHLPRAALAAVVIASALGLIEVTELSRLYRIQRWEFWLCMACLVGVAVVGAMPGIVLAIAMALLQFLWAAWRPHSAVLGRVEGMKGYHDIARHPEARQVPGLVMFRWDAPLFFANAEQFQTRALDAVASAPGPVHWLVVTAAPVTSVDVTAADVLADLHHSLGAAGITLCFAEMKGPVKDTLKRFGLFSMFGEQRFFATAGEAVRKYLEAHPVPWVDWEDRLP